MGQLEAASLKSRAASSFFALLQHKAQRAD
jgi:hypothetical protein